MAEHLAGGVVGRGPRVPGPAELAHLRLVGAVVTQHVQEVQHVACAAKTAMTPAGTGFVILLYGRACWAKT